MRSHPAHDRPNLPAGHRTFQQAEEYCDAFARETDVARWAELNWQFHACLYVDANRSFLLNVIRSVNDRIERYLRIQLTLSGVGGRWLP